MASAESIEHPESGILVKKRANAFVALAHTDAFYVLQLVGVLEWAGGDNSFGNSGTNSGNVLKFSL